MNRMEIAERFAWMWRTSREDSGKSQDYVAKALGVSKSTVQNWENGTSCPNQMKGFEWFQVLGLQPISYYLQMMYPSIEGISNKSDDKLIEESLITCIKACTPEQKRKLFYLFFGGHGSSPSGIIELMTAHLHTSLRDRINVALCVAENYEMAQAQGNLVGDDHIKPDMDILRKSLKNGRIAVIQNKNSYTNMGE